jgi:hypothetical protein
VSVVEMRAYGTWTGTAGGAQHAAIERFEAMLGCACPVELVELWSCADGGELVIEWPEDDTGLEPYEYSPYFVLESVAGTASRWLGLTRSYLGQSIPFASDAGPTLFVWRRGDQGWDGIYAVPRGDLCWDSAALCGATLRDTLDRWRSVKEVRRARQ